jgi:hypothetical protein
MNLDEVEFLRNCDGRSVINSRLRQRPRLKAYVFWERSKLFGFQLSLFFPRQGRGVAYQMHRLPLVLEQEDTMNSVIFATRKENLRRPQWVYDGHLRWPIRTIPESRRS